MYVLLTPHSLAKSNHDKLLCACSFSSVAPSLLSDIKSSFAVWLFSLIALQTEYIGEHNGHTILVEGAGTHKKDTAAMTAAVVQKLTEKVVRSFIETEEFNNTEN